MEPWELGPLLLLQQGKGEVQGKRIRVREASRRDNPFDGQKAARQRSRVQEGTHGCV